MTRTQTLAAPAASTAAPAAQTATPRAVDPTRTTPASTSATSRGGRTPNVLRGLVRLTFFVTVVGGFMLAASQPVTAIPLAAVLIVVAVLVLRRG